MCEDWSHCLWPQKLQICKLDDIRAIPKTISGDDYSIKNDELRKKKILSREQFIFTVDRARGHYSVAEAELETERKRVHSRTKRRQIFPIPWELCTIYPLPRKSAQFCLDNNASEAEVITDTKKSRKVNHQVHWRTEQNGKELNLLVRNARNEFWQTASKPSLCNSLRSEECVVKVVGENWEENCSQGNRTPQKDQKVTLRNTWGHKNFDACQACLGKQKVILQDVELWLQFHQRVAFGQTRIYKDNQYIQRIKDFSSMMLSCHRRIIPSLNRSSRRCTHMFDSWSLPNNSIIHAVHFQNLQNDALRCIIFSVSRNGPMKSRPDYHESSGPLFAWIEEAEQNPQIVCRDDPQEAQMAFFDLAQLE